MARARAPSRVRSPASSGSARGAPMWRAALLLRRRRGRATTPKTRSGLVQPHVTERGSSSSPRGFRASSGSARAAGRSPAGRTSSGEDDRAKPSSREAASRRTPSIRCSRRQPRPRLLRPAPRRGPSRATAQRARRRREEGAALSPSASSRRCGTRSRPRSFRAIPRYGARAGMKNPHFLDVERFQSEVLAPLPIARSARDTRAVRVRADANAARRARRANARRARRRLRLAPARPVFATRSSSGTPSSSARAGSTC